MDLSCFKAYDIRGRVPEELDVTLAYRLGQALHAQLGPGAVVLGRDVRLSSPALQTALSDGLRSQGRGVIDIGVGGTEEVYFQTFHRGAAGGVMVTASHNPMDYNGMKLVREGARPISGDTGLFELREACMGPERDACAVTGSLSVEADKSNFVQHLLSYVAGRSLQPLRIVCNAGNGGAGLCVDALAPHLPFEFVRIQHAPDGSFPNGIPNPLLPECREATARAVVDSGANFGVAWDGDFDRCFFFDHRGRFIEGYYLVGLLATALLRNEPGGRVIHDPRLTWNTIEQVRAAGGVPVMSKTGHAFIKERMRAEDAVYGGEMSAHHYFRDFAYCDSGMIPWLLIAALVSESGQSLADLVDARISAYPCSGEINFKVSDAPVAVARIEERYARRALAEDRTDGLSLEFDDWRFNLRSSNTEPLLRLNVEARGDIALMQRMTQEISALITS
jgi:phosphomannomutase/phosphoglucomutase